MLGGTIENEWYMNFPSPLTVLTILTEIKKKEVANT